MRTMYSLMYIEIINMYCIANTVSTKYCIIKIENRKSLIFYRTVYVFFNPWIFFLTVPNNN